MARKPWEQLTPGYRARLERGGIGKAQHESGATLAKARGHKTPQAESAQQKQNRGINKWAANYSRFYGRDIDDVKDVIDEYGKSEVWKGIQLQTKAQELYDQGRLNEARRVWETRDQSLPDWMFYYHGYFS